MLSEIFWVFVVTTASALCAICFKVSLDSKCKEVQCGCIKIVRDIDSEVKMEEFKIDHGIVPKEIHLPRFREVTREEDIEFGS